MSDSVITKSEQPNPDEVLAAIQSFNDPSIITNIFKELGWSYSLEIKETLTLAKQNANLSIKFKAIRHLRELLREAAETAGYTANVSQTMPNAAGGHTTFSAKRIAGVLNPLKKIESTEIKEIENDKTKETEPDRRSDRGQSSSEKETSGADANTIGTDTRCAFPTGDADSGGIEPPNGGETPRQSSGVKKRDSIRRGSPENGNGAVDSDSEEFNPCIKTRPPTCNRDLFPGISSAEKG